jgi:serine/threonine protein kinase
VFEEPDVSDDVTTNDVHAKDWRERWDSVRSLQSGNQGLASEAADAQGRRAFIKELIRVADSSRRHRFYREVRILANLKIPGIPRLIESNVAHHADESYKLFLAAEFVDGRRLSDIVSSTDIPVRHAVTLTLAIVRIVAAAHAVDVLHRDIKPDNVVVRSMDGTYVPHLVDFGMAYVDESPTDFSTKRSEEIGNRFMRLPEFTSGLENKHDRRSDYTFCVGLLFFMLTKRKPSVLRDEQDRAPHAWRIERIVLRESGLEAERLFRFFDVGFAYEIEKRFQTADLLIAALEGLLLENDRGAEDVDALVRRVSERYATPARRTHAERRTSGERLLAEFGSTLRAIVRELGGMLSAGGYSSFTVQNRYVGIYRVSDAADHLKTYHPTMTVEDAGSEQTVTVTDNFERRHETRVAIGDALSEEQQLNLRAFLVGGIDQATSDDRFYRPVSLEPSRHNPGEAQQPGDEISGPRLPRPRPHFEIAWYPPRTVNGRLMLAWDIKNVGDGAARDVEVFVSNVASYREGEMAPGNVHANERSFAEVKAHHEFTNGAHVLVEFRDERGELHRQMGDVNASPASAGRRDATYVTTQLGFPYWVLHHAVHPDDGVDRFYATEPPHLFNAPD